jgi:hypothetical protein
VPQLQLAFEPFRNAGLFADHYLRDVLPTIPELWAIDGLELIRQELLALWQEQQAHVAQYSEAQLEDHFIKPVLRILGHVYEPQPLAGQHQPDYAFFADEGTRGRVLPADGRSEYWSSALAVADAKAWPRKLDRTLQGGAGWDFQNPSFQIYYYLAETGCRWALLTNGRLWRLYSGDPRPDMARFYEVDLPALLEAPDSDAFAYFWLFFRQQAFLPDPDGRSFLDRVRAESGLAAEKLREDVQEGVYRALLEACRGFFGHSPNALSDADLAAVHDNALVFLYRLLFVLYAEAAELLPVRGNSRYQRQYSLHAVKQQVAADPAAYVEGAAALWHRLKDLFGIIDRGHDALGVPAYNGGLFDPAKHPLLDRWEMDDCHVAAVVDLLARTPQGPDGAPGRFVDYRDLDVRHLGSIYEGLLEYRLARAVQPMIAVREQGKEKWVPDSSASKPGADRCDAGDLYLVTDRGERKATGSYYTPQFIVEYIVEHTLGPLVDECASAADVLKLKVLDPAMGSGHFLVEATDFLARKLLERGAASAVWGKGLWGVFRWGSAGTEESDLVGIKRLVVEHCIYGVDLNPLAVELAKLSLWLDTVAQGQPLSFLDHHLRCGNSLIGARMDDLPAPPRAEAKRSRVTSKQEAAGQLALFDYAAFVRHASGLVFAFGEIAHLLSNTREAVQHKGEILRQLEQAHRRPYVDLADLWCSRHFGNDYDQAAYNELVRFLQEGDDGLSEPARGALDRSRALAGEYRFFHWELEFPEVFFDEHGKAKQDPGFDAVIGNPPWERIKLEENEFFALRAPTIALAPTAAKRKALVAKLPDTDPGLWAEYRRAKQRADLELAWTRNSGLYPFMGCGDTNLYAVMTERGRALLAPRGREGFLVPSGIATDSTTSGFFADLVETKTLQTLLDFENSEGLFPDVHREQKFSVLLLTGGQPQEEIACGFFLHNAGDLADPARVFPLRPADCLLMNPNTRTCPIFRTRRDLELTRGVYERVPVLVRETKPREENPWGVRYSTMFHMTNDSGLFRTAAELEADGFYPVKWTVWRKGETAYLPLYEGKMVWHFDHRYANVLDSDELTKSVQAAEAVTLGQKSDPGFSASPRYWVPEGECRQLVGPTPPKWLLGFRDVVNPNNIRTFVAAFVPPVATGNKLPLLLPQEASLRHLWPGLAANLCAFVFDYVTRRKIGSRTANWFAVAQLAVLPPSRYDDDFHGVRLADFVSSRVLELTYTAHDIAGFAEDMGYVDEQGNVKPPFAWDEERRLHLRCQLDALYFHLYGLTHDEADYVLGTFPIVRRHDEAQFGTFRTRDLILHYYNAYAAGDMTAWVSG